MCTWCANAFKTDGIALKRQESAASHPKNLKCFQTNRHVLAVDLVPIQKSRMVPPGRKNLLSRCVISGAGFCSERSSGHIRDALAGSSVSNTDYANESSVALIFTFVLDEHS